MFGKCVIVGLTLFLILSVATAKTSSGKSKKSGAVPSSNKKTAADEKPASAAKPENPADYGELETISDSTKKKSSSLEAKKRPTGECSSALLEKVQAQMAIGVANLGVKRYNDLIKIQEEEKTKCKGGNLRGAANTKKEAKPTAGGAKAKLKNKEKAKKKAPE